jgi:SNF2 family DNA or RNA helicase
MENRLIEFQRLAYLIDPEKVQHLTGLHQWNSELFRAAAAPIYLRRNQEDVLPELPELIEIDEWVSFTRDDHLRFEGALERSGNFIPLRYAAFPNGHSGGNSAKLERLVALVEEAVEDGLKVAVYSEYHATIDAVVSALRNIGCPTFGPFTGAVPPPQRLALIKELTEHTGGAALVSQIQAGGIGLNIQAASVVILCEPAIKPSIEVQAIARSFRMGQTRVVRVHRLLTEEGIDQRIRQLLSTKQAEFDTYVRHSSIAENSAAAMERDVVGSLTAYAAQEAAARGIAS